MAWTTAHEIHYLLTIINLENKTGILYIFFGREKTGTVSQYNCIYYNWKRKLFYSVQAKKFVEGVPQVVQADVKKEEAERLKTALEAVGGVVEVE